METLLLKKKNQIVESSDFTYPIISTELEGECKIVKIEGLIKDNIRLYV